MVRQYIKIAFMYLHNPIVGKESTCVEPHVSACGLATPQFCLRVDRAHLHGFNIYIT